MLLKFVYLILAYLLGAVPFGLLIGNLVSGVDVRASGSGNIGATNVARTSGRTWGVVTLLADVAKAAAPAWMALVIWPGRPGLAAAAGTAALIGHCFPIYLRFRGGKGVACAIGAWLVIAPAALGLGLIAFLIVVALTKMVSLGSLSLALVVTVAAGLRGAASLTLGLMVLMAAIIFYRHRANIKRILNGTENRL